MAEKKAPDLGQAEVQANMDKATEQGYIGETPDPTPNEAYTVQGAASGAPTPETDPDALRANQERAEQNFAPLKRGEQ
jgi:hypothetical protein